MHVEVLDRDAGQYRCRLGDIQGLPDQLPAGPPPAIVAFAHWSNDPRLRRRTVAEVDYIDIDHQGRVWTYRLFPAYETVPAERIASFYQLAAGFDVGVLPD